MHIKVSGRMLFTWFILAGFILLFAPQSFTGKCQLAFSHIFHWPLTLGRSICLSNRTRQLPVGVITPGQRRYLNHIANLEKQLLQEHNKLEELSKIRLRLPLEAGALVPAYVITGSLSSTSSEIVINQGEADGLKKGQFVLGDNSIIGQISETDSRQARVMLFTDPRSKIVVQIGKLKIERVMQGQGANIAKIRLVSTEHNLGTGEKVFVRKKPGLLDVPIIIGTVTECIKDLEKPWLWNITVEPVCDIENLQDVDVIVMNPPEHLRI